MMTGMMLGVVLGVVMAHAQPLSSREPQHNQPRACNVVITGGSGFLGRHLLRTFPTDTYNHVMVLGRQGQDAAWERRLSTTQPNFVELDLAAADVEAEYAEAIRAVQGADVVVHAAGVMTFFPTDGNEDGPKASGTTQDAQIAVVPGTRAYIERVNINGTRIIAQNMRAGATLVYVSSTEAMGACTECKEDERAQPWCAYGRSKLAAEAHLRRATRQRNASHIILRMTGLMGPEDDFSLYQLMLAVHLGLLPFTVENGSARLMYTHVDDAVQAVGLSMVAAAAKAKCTIPPETTATSSAGAASSPRSSSPKKGAPLDETFLIGPPNALSVREWITAVATELGRPPPFAQLPLPFVRILMAGLDPLLNALVREPFLFKPEMVDRLLENRTYSSAKARELLGYAPRYTCQQAVATTAAWYLEQGWLTPAPISLVEAVLSLLIATFVLIVCGSRRPPPQHLKAS